MANGKIEKNLLVANYWFWVLAMIVVGSFLIFFKINMPASPTSQSDQSYLVLDFGNGTVKQFQGQVVSDMTVLDALNSASMGGHFDFRYSITEGGVLRVAKIGDIANLGGSPSWHFYLNGISIDVDDIGRTIIQSGDKIEARYEQ